MPCGAREELDFHKRENDSCQRFRSIHINIIGKTRVWRGVLRKINSRSAPNPVTGLWTGCTRLKKQTVTGACFRLTKIIEGVQQDRSLTAS
jgi:hypothetical protein